MTAPLPDNALTEEEVSRLIEARSETCSHEGFWSPEQPFCESCARDMEAVVPVVASIKAAARAEVEDELRNAHAHMDVLERGCAEGAAWKASAMRAHDQRILAEAERDAARKDADELRADGWDECEKAMLPYIREPRVGRRPTNPYRAALAGGDSDAE